MAASCRVVLSASLVALACPLASFLASLVATIALAYSVVSTNLVESTTRFFFFLALLSATLLRRLLFSTCIKCRPSSNDCRCSISFVMTDSAALGVVQDEGLCERTGRDPVWLSINGLGCNLLSI